MVGGVGGMAAAIAAAAAVNAIRNRKRGPVYHDSHTSGLKTRAFKRRRVVRRRGRRMRTLHHRRAHILTTPQSLHAPIRMAKMKYLYQGIWSSGKTLTAATPYVFTSNTDGMVFLANSCYQPNYYYPSGSGQIHEHASMWSFLSNMYNSFEVKSSHIRLCLRQTSAAAGPSMIFGIKLHDATPLVLGKIETLGAETQCRYKKFCPNALGTGKVTIGYGFKARKRFTMAESKDNCVTWNGSWSYPADLIFFTPFIAFEDPVTTATVPFEISVLVTYNVLWSDPRTNQDWDNVAANVKMEQS